jgi:hypothetical protein
MNLLDCFNDNDTLIDCSISIIQEANRNGFNGFSGYCGQAAILINECLFDNTQQIFASFNQCLQEKGYHIGHIACLIDLPDGSYFILDSDAELKFIEDIEHWAMLDCDDVDYQKLFDKYDLEKTQSNFETVSQLILTKDFVFEHFNCSHIQEQKKILLDSINKVLPLFCKDSCALKPKTLHFI